jgi:predicted nucleic acid-binding protein
MHRTGEIVINTGPILALIAGTGSLEILNEMYSRVLVPFEVRSELMEGGSKNFGVQQFNLATFLEKATSPIHIQPFLTNTLDLGESSVIQMALDANINTVCIDEAVGRRIARLNGLNVTGSLGVLIKAKRLGTQLSIRKAIANMRRNNIHLSNTVIQHALLLSDEV